MPQQYDSYLSKLETFVAAKQGASSGAGPGKTMG